jgi:hypothetical protein
MVSNRAAGASLVLLFMLAAGCVSPAQHESSAPSSIPTVNPWDGVRAAMAGVPCEATVGSASENSANLKLLSHIDLPSSNDGIHAELDIRGDLAVHARYQSGGFELYDVSDPMMPLHLGNFTETDGALDVKFGPDNVTVFVGTGGGISMVNVADPLHLFTSGKYAWGDLPAPPAGPAHDPILNGHMLYTKTIGGKDWLFLAPNAQTGIWVFEIGGTPINRTLTYVAQTLPVEGGPLGPHDLYVQRDANDGHWYLYSADGFHGWAAFNVDDPAHPLPAGGLVNPAEGAYTHTIQAATINGKRIVATIAEIGVDYLRIYDASVLEAPVLLGVWQAESTPLGSTAPEHNFNIAGGNLYLSYYGHGMYVFNLTRFTSGLSVPLAGTGTLAPVAHWAVGGETVDQGFTGFWDTVVKDGVIYVSFIEGGLVVLGYGCNHVPDSALTSDG